MVLSIFIKLAADIMLNLKTWLKNDSYVRMQWKWYISKKLNQIQIISTSSFLCPAMPYSIILFTISLNYFCASFMYLYITSVRYVQMQLNVSRWSRTAIYGGSWGILNPDRKQRIEFVCLTFKSWQLFCASVRWVCHKINPSHIIKCCQ